MGGVLCALQTAATAVRDWASQQAKVVAANIKSIWDRFANFMCNLVDLIKEQLSKVRFQYCYSNQTTSASTSTSEDGRSQHVEV